ncbi:sugar phosphate nucleotidyltransferase, partial [Williamsia sp.]|uniref:sugar phosphate nucleotidyltransferase n=1 Tax=Williamsia sp. TaxID=1872085 RepID=UPI002F95C71F
MVSEQLPHIVILAGGGGTRLWPASRRARPKFLMTVRGHQTMLDETISRATMFTDPDRILLVTGARNATEVGVIAERWGVAMIAEPSPRDTAASLVLAALLIQQNDPGAVVISMPADHLIDGSTQFMASMRDCITEAQRDRIACIGVSPQGPNTNFGYVKAPSDESTSPRAATSFHEKPDAAAALRYWRSGAYFWNTAIMGWRSNILLSVAETVAADLAAMVAQAVQTDGTIDGEKWTKLPKIAA